MSSEQLTVHSSNCATRALSNASNTMSRSTRRWSSTNMTHPPGPILSTTRTTERRSASAECFLGLLPGWGGTYLLPHLIGPALALKVIVENPLSQNRMLKGPDAFSLGIADAIFDPADFLAE